MLERQASALESDTSRWRCGAKHPAVGVTTTSSAGSVHEVSLGQEMSDADADPVRRGGGAACHCASTAGRRALLAAGIGVAVGLAAGAADAQSDEAHQRPKEGDLLVKEGSEEPVPLGPDSLAPGAGQVMAWPMDPTDKVVRNG